MLVWVQNMEKRDDFLIFSDIAASFTNLFAMFLTIACSNRLHMLSVACYIDHTKNISINKYY